MKYIFLIASQLLFSIFTLSSKDILSEIKIISKAGGEGGEIIKKNGFAGIRVGDDFWNLEI